MLRKLLVAGLAFGFANSIALAESIPALSADQIVSKNVAARGGLKAWRAVHTLSESGKMGAGGDNRQAPLAQIPGLKRPAKQADAPTGSPRLAQEAQLPFVLDLERPRKMRLELQFAGKTAIQVYDGTNGWKLRPFLNRMEVENYTENELHLAAMQSDLDGPLVDYAAKGTKVDADGTEKVDGKDNYRLKLTLKDGRSVHVWIDAETFLESKMDGMPRVLDGEEHGVEVYYKDYRKVDGLVVPFTMETKVLPVSRQVSAKHPGINSQFPVERITIEKVQVNPTLEASLFTKPVVETASLAKPK